MFSMTDVTRILNAIEQGDPSASDKLLPLVYEELHVLARQRLANEKPGQTLQATALVHEAYLRLVGKDNDQSWDNRGHFFAAAAEAMRRILVEAARRKKARKRGAAAVAFELLDNLVVASRLSIDELLELTEALSELENMIVRQPTS
jgi:RNA polymerase sigma factor (TIGR02999 family)